jgi:hypothetical protein
MKRRRQTGLTKQAFWFVVTIGIVNLFGDVTYEGARAVSLDHSLNRWVRAHSRLPSSQVVESCLVTHFALSQVMSLIRHKSIGG